MAERDVETSGLRELAVAVAAAATMSGGKTEAGGGDGGPSEPPTPWKTLGSWQIGGSINA
jgi:hypothetical protein